MTKLADGLHPIALGEVKRWHSQSKRIVTKLIELVEPRVPEHEIEGIVAKPMVTRLA